MKLTEKKLEQKIKFHEKKKITYENKLMELQTPKIGFKLKNSK